MTTSKAWNHSGCFVNNCGNPVHIGEHGTQYTFCEHHLREAKVGPFKQVGSEAEMYHPSFLNAEQEARKQSRLASKRKPKFRQPRRKGPKAYVWLGYTPKQVREISVQEPTK